MYEVVYNKHYIKHRDDGAVTDIWSDGPQPGKDTSDAVCINDKGGYLFRISPGAEENPPIRNMDGIPLYKWDGRNMLLRTEEEVAAERSEIVKEQDQQLRTEVIKQQLVELDGQAIRPLRAILAGLPTDEDRDKLRMIEEQAVALRNELVEMEGVN